MNPLRLGFNVLRYLGPRIVWLRAGVYLRQALGSTRNTFPSRSWEAIELSDICKPGTPCSPAGYSNFKRTQKSTFLFPLGKAPVIPADICRATSDRDPSLRERINLLRNDRCVYFFHKPSPVSIDWYRNPIDEAKSDPGLHFSDIPDYLPEQGDMRMLWEPSRAAWALDCARAHARGGFDDLGPLYWHWVDSWMDACPPFDGFQWKCGQESSVRLMAILTGFWALADDATTTASRYQQIARLVWATGFRIYHHINYAISQKNNHAISEACGLLLAGYLFPELREADQWRARGRNVLYREVARQNYEDGSYVQHSLNYQRVMLQATLLAMRLAELAGEPFCQEMYERVNRSGEFLFQMMDPETGRIPLYGANDGSHILPLNECDFLDFRPVVQASHFLTQRRKRLAAGPWDEDLAWLFGADAVDKECPEQTAQTSKAFHSGGYYTLRQSTSWCLLRCHTYRDRPGQCDQLHLDLWWRGHNVLRDSGSYRYYVPERPDLEHYFKSVRAHNTVEVDGQDPLELASRFLWFPWPRGHCRHHRSVARGVHYLEAEHYDYDRSPWRVLHRRSVLSLEGELWVIVDDLLQTGNHPLRTFWHLCDWPLELDEASHMVRLDGPEGPFSLCVSGNPVTAAEFKVIRGRDEVNQVQGFASPHYGERVPVPTVEIDWNATGPQRIVTALGPGPTVSAQLSSEDEETQHWTISNGGQHYDLTLNGPKRSAERVFEDHLALQNEERAT